MIFQDSVLDIAILFVVVLTLMYSRQFIILIRTHKSSKVVPENAQNTKMRLMKDIGKLEEESSENSEPEFLKLI